MMKEIELFKNNDKRDWTDLEWVIEFNDFLQGIIPEKISLGRGHSPKLSKNKAFAIIWYLQEHFPILPDHFYKCDVCGDLYDGDATGYCCESNHKSYCGNCITNAPDYDDL